MNTDWISTTRQAIPRVPLLLRQLQPSFHLPSPTSVDERFLKAQGIDAVVWDVDGTIMSYHARSIAPEFEQHLRTIFARQPGRHAILSNCGEDRFLELGAIFPEIVVVRGYARDGDIRYRTLRDGVDSLPPPRPAALLDAGATQVRKPDGRLIRFAASQLGAIDLRAVVMVGDQYFTDIAEANLGGARSIKVPTFRRESFPAPIRMSQRCEGAVYRILHGHRRQGAS